MIPGAGLMGLASRLVGLQTMQHRAFTGRAVNTVGDFISTYAAPVAIYGSFQPMGKELMQQLGLNLSKAYATLYTTANVQPTQEGRSGDIILYQGRTWQAESTHEWRLVGEVGGTLLVEVPPLE